MTPADLSRTVVRAVRRAVEDGELVAEVPARVVVERSRPGGVGEYASPVAFQLAKGGDRAPADVARVLARRLGAEPGIRAVEITGAGFLNFELASGGCGDLVRDVLEQGLRYGYGYGCGYGAGGVPVEAFRWDEGVEPRSRVVREAVVRLVRSQGDADGPGPLTVAPVARGDGDVFARFGADGARWGMLTVPARETPVLSARLLLQDESNDLFRVRYAHSRARALLRNGPLLDVEAECGEVPASPGSRELLRLLGEYPLVLETAAHHRAPEQLARHLVLVADALLDFQHHVLPLGDEKPSAAHRARLALAEAAGTVLAGGLALLGIGAPEYL
ncbi:ArgS-related anticodon-binding protein NrtL [Streptomyces sp. NPDC090022]|uniref:ArgS-related anticodon-binding protein NrtL n=1 Tax=Streptomyces sp. NPDC090022 TaxID=3365920 RepID=UPI0038016AD5